MNIKESIKGILGTLSRPKTLATLQLVVAVVTVLHAVKKLREAGREEE